GLSLNAQSVISTLEPVVVKMPFKNYIACDALGDCNSAHYIFRSSLVRNQAISLPNSVYSDWIYAFDPETDSIITKCEFEVSEEYIFEYCFLNENKEVVGIYSHKDDDKYFLYVNTFSKTANGFAWEPKLLGTFTDGRGEHCSLIHMISPDKSKICLTVMKINYRTDQFLGAFVMALNLNGEILWENNVTFDFENRKFSIRNCVIDNEGNALYTITSYVEKDEKKEKVRTENKLHIYQVYNQHVVSSEEDMDFGMIDYFKIKLLKNGNLFLGGYHAPHFGENATGSFSLIYDVKAERVKTFQHTDFPADYQQPLVKGHAAKEFANQQYYVTCEELYELDNGTIVMLGEQKKKTQFYIPLNGITYRALTKNVLYHSFSPTGEEWSMKMFRKPQYFTSYSSNNIFFKRYYLSFHSFQKGNDIYLLFNDYAGNYNGKKTHPYVVDLDIKGNSCVVFLKINENGEEERKVLYHNKDDKRILQELFWVGDHYLIVSNLTRRQLMFDKVEVSF
ncbi:MAG: hypothetical protein RR034_07660, partial [Bacteroidales bacterium]